MSTTLVRPEPGQPEAPAPAGWLFGVDARPRRAGARRLAALLLALAIAVICAGAVTVVWQANEPALSTTLAASADDGGAALYRARLEPRRRRVMLTPVGGFDALSRTHSRQLWMMRVYGPPVPIGLLDPRRTTTLAIDEALLAPDNPPTHLFVSVEAVAGSKADHPRGATVAQGALASR